MTPIVVAVKTPGPAAVRSSPTGSEVIVAASPVPVVTPARVPEIARAPLREWPRLSLSLDCVSKTGQTYTSNQSGRRSRKMYRSFHVILCTNCFGPQR
jgi:hypothetical protein